MNALTLTDIRDNASGRVCRVPLVLGLKLELAARLWADKMPISDMCRELGASESSLKLLKRAYPERFPPRLYKPRIVERAMSAKQMGRVRAAAGAQPEPVPRTTDFKVPTEYEPGLSRYRCEPAAAREPGAPIGMMELTDRTCRWPVSRDAGPMLFCGGYFDGNGSYCNEHRKKAFTPRTCERGRT